MGKKTVRYKPGENVGGKNKSYWGAHKRKQDYDKADDWRTPKSNKWDKLQQELDDENDQFKDIFED